MKLNKLELLNSDYGKSIIECLYNYNEAVLDCDKHLIDVYSYQIQVHLLTLEAVFGIKYTYIRNDEYYGLFPENEHDYLIKVYIRR